MTKTTNTTNTTNATLRSNSKEVTERIRKHIVERLNTDYTQDIKEQLTAVFDEFQSWYGPYEKRRTPNIQDAFAEFLKCLPSCLSTEYMYVCQREALEYFFDGRARKPKKDWTDEQVSKMYYSLIYREFNALCKLYHVSEIRYYVGGIQ